MRVTCFVKALVFGRGFVVLKREKSARPAGNVAPPPSGDPTKLPAAILRGAPFGLSSPHCVTARARLRGGVNFAAHLSHGCSFSPSEYTFGGDPLESSVLYHGSVVTPLPAGFPRNRSPLKGDPPFRGKPSALGHEGVRGRRLHGAAMLCRLQCARFAKRVAHCRRTFRQPSALIRSPRRSRGLRPVSAW